MRGRFWTGAVTRSAPVVGQTDVDMWRSGGKAAASCRELSRMQMGARIRGDGVRAGLMAEDNIDGLMEALVYANGRNVASTHRKPSCDHMRQPGQV
jgi:hypothetical protein